MSVRRRQGRWLAIWVLGCGVLGCGLELPAQTGQGQAPVPPAAPQAQGTGSCRLVKDATGNLVLDPSCPPIVVPSTGQVQGAGQPAGQGSGLGSGLGSTAPGPTAPAAKRFPFPGESSGAGQDGQSQGQPGSAVPAAGSGVPAAPDAPASKRYPYPGESDGGVAAPDAAGSSSSSSSSSASSSSSSSGSEAPAAGRPVPGQPPLQDAGSSGDSSSSGSDSASSAGGGAAGDDDASGDGAGGVRRRTTRRKLPAVSAKSTSEQEEEDVQVAGFYQNDGNFKGAYERAKDAVTLDKDDPAAHLALAESARRLGKLDEAETEYKRCLGLDPVPKVRKVAEKAMREMTGGE